MSFPKFSRRQFFGTLANKLILCDSHSSRSSHQRCSVRKGVLRYFTKFTEKHLCQSLFFNKVAGLRTTTLFKKRLWHRPQACNFIKKETQAQVFSCEFCKISKNTFFAEHHWGTAYGLIKFQYGYRQTL